MNGNTGRNGYETLPPCTLLNPTPVVLVSCAEKDHPERRNLVTAAWAGTVNSEPPMVSVSLRKERFSHAMIRDSEEFVVNLADEGMCRAVDFCGVRSGRDLDKAEAAGIRYRPAEKMRFAPAADGAPLSLSCRVRQIIPLGSHDLFLGRVEQVGVKPEMMDEAGRIDYGKMRLAAYNHGNYYALGEALGFFGYSVAAPDVLERRMKQLRG